MARDKLITVRIEEDLRESFNQWAKDNGSDASTVLYDYIKRCLDGRIDANLATGKTVIGLDEKCIDMAIDKRLDGLLDNVPTRDELQLSLAELRSEFQPALDVCAELAGKYPASRPNWNP